MVLKGKITRLTVGDVELDISHLSGPVVVDGGESWREAVKWAAVPPCGSGFSGSHVFKEGEQFCQCGETEREDPAAWVLLADMERIWNQN